MLLCPMTYLLLPLFQPSTPLNHNLLYEPVLRKPGPALPLLKSSIFLLSAFIKLSATRFIRRPAFFIPRLLSKCACDATERRGQSYTPSDARSPEPERIYPGPSVVLVDPVADGVRHSPSLEVVLEIALLSDAAWAELVKELIFRLLNASFMRTSLLSGFSTTQACVVLSVEEF